MKRFLGSLVIAAAVIGIAFSALPASAADFPSKPVLAVVPFSPGGGNDIVIRLVAKYITPALGQALVVENKPGAGGQIGWTALAKARPDGYTRAPPTSSTSLRRTRASSTSQATARKAMCSCNI